MHTNLEKIVLSRVGYFLMMINERICIFDLLVFEKKEAFCAMNSSAK